MFVACRKDESLAAGVGPNSVTADTEPNGNLQTASTATTEHSTSGSTSAPGGRQPPTITNPLESREVNYNSTRNRTGGGATSSSGTLEAVKGEQVTLLAIPDGHRVGDEGVSDFVSGDVDFADFEDFDDDGFDAVEEMNLPGHDEWPDEHISDIVKEESTRGAGRDPFLIPPQSDSHSTRTESTTNKPKLSLKQQKSTKMRVCEMEPGVSGRRENERGRNLPVASVKPIPQQKQQFPQRSIEPSFSSSPKFLSESELFEESVTVRNVFEVKSHPWKLHPYVKLKVRTCTVCPAGQIPSS